MITARHRASLLSGKWFAALEPSFQEALLSTAQVLELEAGARLFSRGDPPSGLYAVLDGAIRFSGTTDDGKEALLALSEAPAWFGEVSVLDGQPRTHDAVAEGTARVLWLPQDKVLELMEQNPRRWREIGLLAALKLRMAFATLEAAAILPLPVRIAARLVMMAEGYGHRQGHTLRSVEVGQETLANMLSTSRQSVNQTLKDLEARGLLKVAYGRIEILDLDALKKMSS